jgi:hypothetical protein
MIDIANINIDDCYGVDFLLITFTVSDMTKPPENYKFDLYRSMSPNAAFTRIAEDIDEYRFIDTGVNLLNLNLQYYYKVKVTDITTGEVSVSNIYRYDTVSPDQYAIAIESIESKYLDIIGNQKVYILKRILSGPKCSCYNPNRQDSSQPFCEHCFGTGILGGYYKPILAKIGNYNSNTFSHEYNVMEDADAQATEQVWIQSIPKIENDDLVVDGNSRYIITSHTDTAKNKYLLRQICNISRLPKTNIAYKIPITGETVWPK